MVKASHLKLVKPQDAAVAAWLDRVAQRYAPAEIEALGRALDFVAPFYAERQLASGEAALAHALETAGILAELKLDHETLTAGLLFRSLELTPGAAQQVRDQFGSTIADLAEGVVRMEALSALSSRRPAVQKTWAMGSGRFTDRFNAIMGEFG